MLSGIVELALSLGLERRWRRLGLGGVLAERDLALAYRGGAQALGSVIPAIVHASPLRHARSASTLASIATLVGGLTLRAVLVFAGNRSAQRPRDYLRFTQPSSGTAR
jgi:formate-dependent nitrite reductase membrane component NrfD